MWINDKNRKTADNIYERQYRAQELLKQVEAVYESHYSDKEVADSAFYNWLITQVNVRESKYERRLRPIENCKSWNQVWNSSAKINEKEYKPNLNNFFPRDQYTMLPTDADLVFLNKELKGMCLDEVKKLMKKIPR